MIFSGRRFKEQITDMGDTSSKLLQLRPVNFYYKPEYDDGSHLPAIWSGGRRSRQGVSRDGGVRQRRQDHGRSSYQLLAPMLLNELQKQHAEAEKQDELIRKLEQRIEALEHGNLAPR